MSGVRATPLLQGALPKLSHGRGFPFRLPIFHHKSAVIPVTDIPAGPVRQQSSDWGKQAICSVSVTRIILLFGTSPYGLKIVYFTPSREVSHEIII